MTAWFAVRGILFMVPQSTIGTNDFLPRSYSYPFLDDTACLPWQKNDPRQHHSYRDPSSGLCIGDNVSKPNGSEADDSKVEGIPEILHLLIDAAFHIVEEPRRYKKNDKNG